MYLLLIIQIIFKLLQIKRHPEECLTQVFRHPIGCLNQGLLTLYNCYILLNRIELRFGRCI